MFKKHFFLYCTYSSFCYINIGLIGNFQKSLICQVLSFKFMTLRSMVLPFSIKNDFSYFGLFYFIFIYFLNGTQNSHSLRLVILHDFQSVKKMFQCLHHKIFFHTQVNFQTKILVYIIFLLTFLIHSLMKSHQ